jgi:hypothetical protein
MDVVASSRRLEKEAEDGIACGDNSWRVSA